MPTALATAPARRSRRAAARAGKGRAKKRRPEPERSTALQLYFAPDEWFRQLKLDRLPDSGTTYLPPSPETARYRPPRGRQLVFREVIRFSPPHPRGHSVGVGDLSRWEKGSRTKRLKLPVLFDRPQTRQECESSPRPCPWVSCRYHLYLDVVRGALHLNFPDLQPWEMPVSCALDVAELDGMTLPELGVLLNVTMERSRQIFEDAIGKLQLFAESNPSSPFVRAIEAKIRGEEEGGGD